MGLEGDRAVKRVKTEPGTQSPKRIKSVKTEPGTQDNCVPIKQIKRFAWRDCAGLSDSERLAIKEQAVLNADAHAASLCDILRHISEDSAQERSETFRKWIGTVEALSQRHEEFKVLVGVAGATGAGKTSLLNAILGIRELLPSGQEQAATAVVCKVSWNHDSRPGYECRAEVIFQPPQQIQRDIARTLEAIKFRSEVDDMEYETEDERIEATAIAAAQIKEGLTKILAVWSISEEDVIKLAAGSQDTDQLQAAAKTILNYSSEVTEMIKSGIKYIKSADPETLGNLIKPFLDSTTASHGGSNEFAAWPLIQNVNIFLRTEILRTGINLVDLPGTADNVESRARIAEDFYDKLDVTLLVAQIHRAADERTTQKHIGAYQQLQMSLNASGGGREKYNLGVVLSKMDDMDVDTYIRTSKDATDDTILYSHQEEFRDEDHLDEILDGFREAIEAIQQWCGDGDWNIDLGVDLDPLAVKEGFTRKHKESLKKLKVIMKTLQSGISKVDPLQDRPESEKSFRSQSIKSASRWSLKFPDDETQSKQMAWNTYRAIIVRGGGPYSSPSNRSLTYDWAAQLAVLFLNRLIKPFNVALFEKLKGLWQVVRAPLTIFWNEYMDELKDEAISVHPAWKTFFSDSRDQLNVGSEKADREIGLHLRKLTKNMKVKMGNIKRLLKEQMAPFLMEASEPRGKGSHAMRKIMVQQGIQDNSSTMFRACWRSVEQHIEHVKRDSAKQLDAIASEVIKAVELKIDMHLQNILGKEDSINQPGVEGEVKKIVKTWESDWISPRGDFQHILQKDLQIPSEIRQADLEAFMEENDNSDAESDSSNSDGDESP